MIAFSNPQKVIGYQTECILIPFFFFSLENFLLMILSQHGFSTGNPFQDLRRPSEGSRELFVQIYRFSFAGLLQNIFTESLVMDHMQMKTQKQVKKKTNKICKNGRSVPCVIKVLFHVVVSLNHLSRRKVGHHLRS